MKKQRKKAEIHIQHKETKDAVEEDYERNERSLCSRVIAVY